MCTIPMGISVSLGIKTSVGDVFGFSPTKIVLHRERCKRCKNKLEVEGSSMDRHGEGNVSVGKQMSC